MQVAGMVCIAVAVGMVATWAGLLVAGIELVLLGTALEMRSRNNAG